MIIKDCNIQKIMDSGQCFRISNIGKGRYIVISKDLACIAIQSGSDTELLCNNSDKDYWEEYFNVGIDLEEVNRTLVNKVDYVDRAVNFSKGLRLLKQDKYECLISFIISQRKSIKAIRSSIEKICVNFGEKKEIFDIEYNTFPSVEQLYLKNLDGCGLGYRDKYIEGLIVKLYNSEIDLQKISEMQYNESLVELKKIKGVGDKVANCALLYAFDKINAFPIDVWMQRIIDNEFDGKFPYNEYKQYRGILQLYMFYYERFRYNKYT